MTKSQILKAHYRQLGQLRAKKLTAARRKAIARMGGQARAKKLRDASKESA